LRVEATRGELFVGDDLSGWWAAGYGTQARKNIHGIISADLGCRRWRDDPSHQNDSGKRQKDQGRRSMAADLHRFSSFLRPRSRVTLPGLHCRAGGAPSLILDAQYRKVARDWQDRGAAKARPGAIQ